MNLTLFFNKSTQMHTDLNYIGGSQKQPFTSTSAIVWLALYSLPSDRKSTLILSLTQPWKVNVLINSHFSDEKIWTQNGSEICPM